eukprot:GHVS01086065.1.p1 GENE.GHVS01086065.1~~GHVS01086065.1.p1  ORF type:complete len:262 (-),score=30.63 GHVS01086065.1:88-873(-)
MADLYRVPTLLEVPVGGKNPASEQLMKRIARNIEIKTMVDKAVVEEKKKHRSRRHEMKMRIYKYESLYRKSAAALVDAKREARDKGGYYREDDPKVMFIIRLRGINKLAPKPKKILQLFRLRQIHNGVFMRINKATTQMLKYIEPFVTYGYVNLSTIRKMLYKRGYGRVGTPGHRQRIRLQDTKIITKSLGEHGIHCLEDMIYELYTCGPHFKQVTNFLWPFKLKTPLKGYVAKRHGFNEPRGGDWGNREHLINELLNRMI